ncbi:alpha/beta fold hydrolase [Mameliella alba]|uniref:3-oxoadipate enol-lactone hydrolase n=1 Tax=Mameliella alba TaxID=561184 RepID=A0A0B3S3S0_9RHOB|nr:alpha/beta fold hydrolase [Mameliella alba]KHQ51336.1 3-oxoadipate enol-lactone hydrolase [Mameliella alba]MBY6121510.1 alpha/beta fold hydrolase [Mameliella alba]OWV41306.1 alpha/beta hydrolase [Mameliella alba]OWV57656.1 alpha/beta hydrolase [Mameliella alba]
MTRNLTVPLPDGGQLNARIDGPDGAPWVVFSNSVMTDLSIWDAQATALADRYQVLRYDQRGHGASSLPDGPMSFDGYGADLTALLDHCGITRCVLVGLSMGVPTCLAAAKARPDRVAAFVIVDGVSRSAAGREAFWTERRETARADGMARIAAETAPRWLPDVAADAPLAQGMSAMIAATPVEGFAAATHALASYDQSAALASLTCPVLGLAGEKDGAMPDAIRAQFGALPDIRFDTTPGAGHVPNFQCPEAFNAALAPFLDAVAQDQQELP